jgi:hypothetical protein
MLVLIKAISLMITFQYPGLFVGYSTSYLNISRKPTDKTAANGYKRDRKKISKSKPGLKRIINPSLNIC